MGLQLRTDIPFGNAADVRIVEEGDMPVVEFAADPHGGPESLWFCFRVENTGPSGQSAQVKLVLKHVRNMLGGSNVQALRPVIRQDGGDWQRLGPAAAETTEDGRLHATWQIPAPASAMDVALCYPYGPEEVAQLIADTGGRWRVATIGVSQGGRMIQHLYNDPGRLEGDRPGIYLIARQHSGETPGSWVLDGMLRAFAASGETAPLVWCVPLADVDGVTRGDYGKDGFPYDLNRAWDRPAMRHEVMCIQNDLQEWRRRCRPMLAIDLHAPGKDEADGIYSYVPDPNRRPQYHAAVVRWTARFATALGHAYAAEQFDRRADYPSRWRTPRFSDYCRERLGLTSLIIEIPYAMCGRTLLTREVYQEAGRRLAEAVVDLPAD